MGNMIQDDWKLICLHDIKSGTYCVWPKAMPGLLVQVERLEDAPEQIAISYKCMLKYGFTKGIHEIIDFPPTNDQGTVLKLQE